MNLSEYINKHAGLKAGLKAAKIAIRRGSIQDGAMMGAAASAPAAMLTGATMTTMPAHLMKGSVMGAAALTGGATVAGAGLRTAEQATKILRRAERLKKLRKV